MTEAILLVWGNLFLDNDVLERVWGCAIRLSGIRARGRVCIEGTRFNVVHGLAKLLKSQLPRQSASLLEVHMSDV